MADTDIELTEISKSGQSDVMNQPDTISLEEAQSEEPNSDDPSTSDPGTSDPGTSDPGTSDPGEDE